MSSTAKYVLAVFTWSVLSFFLGRILPKSLFRFRSFPYRLFRFEKNGKIYECLKIRKWQSKIPDMSKLLPKLVCPKRLTSETTPEKIDLLLCETCIAEFIHTVNNVFAILCLAFWSNGAIRFLCFIYVVGNMPFIIVQRYNRPRLERLKEIMQKRAKRKEVRYESPDTELQYGRRA